MDLIYGEFDLEQTVAQLLRMLIAFALALPMGWDREQSDQAMGVRTFPLVAVSACGFVLVAQATLQDEHAISRVIQGVVAGVGFLGGGAIVKQGVNVRGAATAAAVWTTAGVGVATARGELGVAIVLAILGFATLRWFRPLKRVATRNSKGEETAAAPVDELPSEAEDRPAAPLSQ